MNAFVKIGAALFAVFIFFSMVSQCNKRESLARPSPAPAPVAAPVPTDVILKEYAKGLDLTAVSELARKAKDAADFERLLNSSSEAVNNLDLNDDDKVDYIKVSEFGSGDQRGFSLTTEVEPGKVQEIATLEFRKNNDAVTVQTTGNPSLYGPNHFHHSSFGLTDAMLMYWMFSNRPQYQSPYGGGIYPTGYSPWNRRASDQYTGEMSRRAGGSTFTRSDSSVIGQPLASPNATKEAARARAITNPERSQKSFATRSAEGKPAGSGGFGRSSSQSTSGSGSGSYSNPSSSSSGSSPSGSYGSSSSSSGFGRSSSSGSSRSGGFGGGGK